MVNLKTNRKLWWSIAIAVVLVTASLMIKPFAPRFLAPPAIAAESQAERQVKNAVISHLSAGRTLSVKPQVTSVAIAENYALTQWLWGEAGGQAVLVKRGNWRVVSAGGGAVDVRTLEDNGVPARTARVLVEQIQADWPKRQTN
jgi:hypothetical protein